MFYFPHFIFSFGNGNEDDGLLKPENEEDFRRHNYAVINVDQNEKNKDWNLCFWSMYSLGTLNLRVYYYISENFKT